MQGGEPDVIIVTVIEDVGNAEKSDALENGIEEGDIVALEEGAQEDVVSGEQNATYVVASEEDGNVLGRNAFLKNGG